MLSFIFEYSERFCLPNVKFLVFTKTPSQFYPAVEFIFSVFVLKCVGSSDSFKADAVVYCIGLCCGACLALYGQLRQIAAVKVEGFTEISNTCGNGN